MPVARPVIKPTSSSSTDATKFLQVARKEIKSNMKCTNNITTEPRDLLSLVLLPAVTHALMPLAAALGPTTTSTVPLDQTGNITDQQHNGIITHSTCDMISDISYCQQNTMTCNQPTCTCLTIKLLAHIKGSGPMSLCSHWPKHYAMVQTDSSL